MKLQEYFKDSEVWCPCCRLMPPEGIILKAYAIRLIMGIPIIVTSGARCWNYNEDIEGGISSLHLQHFERVKTYGASVNTGALDIVAESSEKHRTHEGRLIMVAQACGITGLGISDNSFLHIDDGDGSNRPAVWTY